jgi:hypothetical protein
MEKSIHNKSTFIIFIKPISSEGEKYIPREPGTCKIVGPVKKTGFYNKNQVLKKNLFFIALIFHHLLHLPHHIHTNPQETIYHS